MARSKKVQFTALKRDIIVELQPRRKGVFWNYADTPNRYGPFKNDQQAIQDAKLYSQYGTTSKHHLLEGNHRYPKPSTYTNRRAYNG